MTLIIILLLFFSYVIALLSAFLVFPFIWLPLGILFSAIGGFFFYRYRHQNLGVAAIGVFTVGVFIALGQYLESYVPAISIPVNLVGSVFSLPMMLIFYYWKEGQRRVEIRVKHEKAEEENGPKVSIWQQISLFFKLNKRKNQLVKEKGIGKHLAWQYAYVEYTEELEKKSEVNSLDFILGKEVTLQRNEYDQNQ